MRESAAGLFRETLISASKNARVEEWEMTGAQVTPDAPDWRVRKEVLHGGRQEGVDVITLHNGRLALTLVPTRGMGLLRAQLGDVRLGWDSPVKEVVHPHHVHLQSQGGLGWLEGFNEWLVRCGLENIGPPGADKFSTSTGSETAVELTLHGRIANLPASEVEIVVDRRPPHLLRVRGRVDERRFGGPKLELWTEISTRPNSSEFRVADTITNRSSAVQEFQILYHANHGPPLLEEGAAFLAPIASLAPRDSYAAQSVAEYARYGSPSCGAAEQVFFLHPLADTRGRTLIGLRNKAGDRAVSMAYSVKELPCLTLWKNAGALEDGYVTGLEPGTSFPSHRSLERRHGRVPRLSPGASYHSTLDIAVHTDGAAVRRVARRIALIQGRRKPVIIRQPVTRR
jgi:acylphosphatase